MADWVKLANPEGSFFDPETGFGLSRDDVRELTEPVGRLTKERIRYGAIVHSDPPKVEDGPAETPVPTEVPEEPETDAQGPVEGGDAAGAEAPMETVKESVSAPSKKSKRSKKQ